MPEFRRHFGKRCGQQAQQATIRGTPKAWEGARRAHEARSSPRDLIEVAPLPSCQIFPRVWFLQNFWRGALDYFCQWRGVLVFKEALRKQ